MFWNCVYECIVISKETVCDLAFMTIGFINLIISLLQEPSMDGHDCDERVLSGEEWKVEALAVIHDVQDHVFDIHIADGTANSDQLIHLNLTTKEKQQYCIELTAQGFRVVGYEYNQINVQSDDYYETPYALLDKLSPMYRQAFGDSLVSKLLLLHSSQRQQSTESEQMQHDQPNDT